MGTHYILGFVVNPKLAQLVLVAGYDEVVRIHNVATGQPIGAGHYGTEDEDAFAVTGLPRVHVGNVDPPGMGFGTSLYSALALGAGLNSKNAVDLYAPMGSGISSVSEDRSKSAEAWWSAAKRKGLATAMEATILTSRYLPSEDARVLQGCLPTKYKERVKSIKQVRVESLEPVSADAYRAESAEQNNLVAVQLAWPKERSRQRPGRRRRDSEELELGSWPLLTEQHVVSANVGAVLAADVRGMHPDVFKILATACQLHGVTAEELDGLWTRWKEGLDPSDPALRAGIAFKPNAQAAEALEQAEFLRSETGWDELADLP